jgi:hypothetical protein
VNQRGRLVRPAGSISNDEQGFSDLTIPLDQVHVLRNVLGFGSRKEHSGQTVHTLQWHQATWSRCRPHTLIGVVKQAVKTSAGSSGFCTRKRSRACTAAGELIIDQLWGMVRSTQPTPPCNSNTGRHGKRVDKLILAHHRATLACTVVARGHAVSAMTRKTLGPSNLQLTGWQLQQAGRQAEKAGR